MKKIKSFFIKVKTWLKNWWNWLKTNVFTKDMFLALCISETIFWSPCIITGILAITVNPWWWTAFWSIILFWSGPFTPGFEIQIALAFLIKKIIKKWEKKKDGTKGKKRP